MRLLPLVALPLAGALAACAPLGSPLAPGAVAEDLGKIGAQEGPAWRDGSLYFTDGQGINRRGPDGVTTVFRAPPGAGRANGLMFDREGRLVACESANRRVTRTEADGTITVLADRYEGHPFNSPNDLSMDARGRIYFTDPRYGQKRDDMEIRAADGTPIEGVYRIDAPGRVTRLTTPGVERPNGILVSRDQRWLYLCDNQNNVAGGARRLVRFALRAGGDVDPASRTVLFDWRDGRGGDGMKMDRAGRLYVMAGLNRASRYETTEFKAGCYVFSPRGALLAFIPTAPDGAANCTFGDEDRRTLFMTSGQHLWRIRVNTAGWIAGDEPRAPGGHNP